MKKRITLWYLTIAILLIGISSAYSQTTFTDGTSNGNFTYILGNEMPSKTIQITAHNVVSNAVLYLKGYLSTNYYVFDVTSLGINNTPYNYRGQFINDTNPNDPGITNKDLANDGKWDTYATWASGTNEGGNNKYYYLNYTIKQFYNYNLTYLVNVAGSPFKVGCWQENNVFNEFGTHYPSGSNISALIPYACTNHTTNLRLRFQFWNTFGNNNIYDFEVARINYTYPTNVSIILNNASVAYNYGLSNGSSLDHQVLVNMTSSFTYSPITLWNLSFRSNTSGILEFSGLQVDYQNVLNLTIHDEATNATISGPNLTVLITKGSSVSSYWTTNGTLNLVGSWDGQYIIDAYSSLYAKNTQVVTFSGGESKIVHLYLLNKTSTTVFTLEDQVTGSIIENALISQYRSINDQWTLITSLLSDVTGKATFGYVQGSRYQFTVDKDGYADKTFTLDANPTLQDTYLVLLQKNNQFQNDTDYFGVYPDFSPREFYDGVQNNITFTFTSPGGFLESYNLSISYPGGGPVTRSGTNSHGETFNITFTITGATITDLVNVSFTYDSTLGNPRTFRHGYYIRNLTSQQGTIEYNRRNGYGMGILERLLIMVIASLIVGGLVMQQSSSMEAGFASAIFMQCIVAYFLGINFLFILPSVLAAIVILSRRTS